MSTHRGTRRFLPLVAVGLTAVLALTGCTAPTLSSDDLATSRLHLTPTGDKGRWLSDDYAHGAHVGYVTSNTVCAITDTLIVEQQDYPGFTSSVVAKDLRNGSVVWEKTSSSCTAYPQLGAQVSIVRDLKWELVDIPSGETSCTLPGDYSLTRAIPLAFVDDILIVKLDELTLAGFRDSSVVWTTSFSNRLDVTALPNGYLGVIEVLDDRGSVIDGRTGATTSEFDFPRSARPVWASDGYMLTVNERDPEHAFYDLHGKEVERTTKKQQYGFTPSPSDGVTFPLADHVAAGTVVGVDADGRPALFSGERRQDFTPHGRIDLPDTMLFVAGVSADGTLLLYDHVDKDRDRVTVIDTSGKEVFGWSAPGGGVARVIAGLIVIDTETTTQVLFPGV